MGGPGVGTGGGRSMRAEGSTPVIISCLLGSRTAGEVKVSKDSTKASKAEGETSGFSSGFFGKVG